MTPNFHHVERLAEQLCNERGDWDRPYTKKAHWRKLAVARIERQRAISTADAFFGIFGMRRAKS